MLPTGVKLWLSVSIPVVLWDLSYVLARPHSMPGGAWAALWKPYVLYCFADGRYADMTDAWSVAQSVGNLVEVALTVLALWRLRGRMLWLALFSVSLMCFWKTCLYFLVEVCSQGQYTKQNSWTQLLLLYILPSSAWLLGPAYVMYEAARHLLHLDSSKVSGAANTGANNSRTRKAE